MRRNETRHRAFFAYMNRAEVREGIDVQTLFDSVIVRRNLNGDPLIQREEVEKEYVLGFLFKRSISARASRRLPPACSSDPPTPFRAVATTLSTATEREEQSTPAY